MKCHSFMSSVLVAAFAASTPVLAQRTAHYRAPRTEHGQPDLRGVWATDFLTPLERPANVDRLVVSPEEARAVVRTLRDLIPAVTDPDVQIHDLQQLARVRGDYRTSLIVDPADGRMPFTAAGLERATAVAARNAQRFDAAEQRPLVERCLENRGYAPIRPVRVVIPREIVQARDHIAIVSEEAAGLRLIGLRGTPPPDAVRSLEGYSSGRWHGDTLVVTTTHLRSEDSSRETLGRPLLLGRDSTITERFTRTSDDELLYRFTVEDAGLYTRPWTGEFSMKKYDAPIYEYACHEGNYSLANILRGGQAQAARVQ